jgi:hypothetical protein
MTNTPRKSTPSTAADLRAAFLRAEAALTRAEAKHAEATAAYPALAAAHAAALAALPSAPRGCLVRLSPAALAARDARKAGDRAIGRATGSVKRARATLARTEAACVAATEAERTAEAAPVEAVTPKPAPLAAAEAKPLAATPEEISAGFMRAADRVFADMARNCARLEAERVKREDALAAASAAPAAANAAWNNAAACEAALHAAAAAVDAAAADAAPAAPDAETLLEEIAALRGQSLDFFMSRAGRARICLRNNPACRAQATRSLAATLEAMRLNLAARAADAASRKLIEAMETEADAAACHE